MEQFTTNESNNRLSIFIISGIFSFAGMLAVVMTFFQVFFADEISLVPLFAVIVFTAFGMSAFFTYCRRNFLAWIVIALLLAFFGRIFWREIAGGFMVICNTIMNKVSIFFDMEVYFYVIEEEFAAVADIKMVITLFVLICTAGFSQSMVRRKVEYIPLVLVAAALSFPLVLELYVPPFFMMLSIAVLVALFVMIVASVRKKNSLIHKKAVLTAAALCFAVTLVGGIIELLVNPDKGDEYEQPAFFQQAYKRGEELVEAIKNQEITLTWLGDLGFNDIEGGFISTGPGGIGKGRLGQTDKIEFSNQEVLQVTLPSGTGKMYIKGFVGKDYSDTKWTQMQKNDYVSIDVSVNENGNQFSPQESLAYAVKMLEKYQKDAEVLSGVERHYMTIRFTGLKKSSQYMPLYPDTSGLNARFSLDCYYYELAEDAPLYYYQLSSSEIISVANWMEQNRDTMNEDLAVEEAYREFVYENYLDVNTICAEQLKEEFDGYPVDTALQRYELAYAIRKYLADKCTYSIEPGKVPAGEDFIDYFLNQTQVGYCTYFATTAVMMFRSAGVPARYVEGYTFSSTSNHVKDSAYKESDGVSYVTVSVKDSNAHAWVEFYIDGVGWVDFEVTPGNYNTQEQTPTEPKTTQERETETETETQSPSETQSGETKTQGETQSTIEKHTGIDKPTAGEEKQVSFHIPEKVLKWLKFAGIILLVLAAAFFVIYFRHRLVLAKRRRQYSVPDDAPQNICIILNYKLFVQMMRFMGKEQKKHIGPRDFAKEIEETCSYAAPDEAVILAELYEKAVFSNRNMNLAEKKQSEQIVYQLRIRIYENLGIIRKLLFCFIWNL